MTHTGLALIVRLMWRRRPRACRSLLPDSGATNIGETVVENKTTRTPLTEMPHWGGGWSRNPDSEGLRSPHEPDRVLHARHRDRWTRYRALSCAYTRSEHGVLIRATILNLRYLAGIFAMRILDTFFRASRSNVSPHPFLAERSRQQILDCFPPAGAAARMAATASAIGISTPLICAISPHMAQSRHLHTFRFALCRAKTGSPLPSLILERENCACGLEHVNTRSQGPDRPSRVSAAPQTLFRTKTVRRIRAGQCGGALRRAGRPVTMPAAIASTFLARRDFAARMSVV